MSPFFLTIYLKQFFYRNSVYIFLYFVVKKIFYLLILLFNIAYSDIYYGYLKEIEMSFCMDECSQYFIESESGLENPINVIFNNDINLNLYLNRFVEINLGSEMLCVECSAFEVEEINLSDECLLPVSCFVDPCSVALPCELNIPVTCESNYCGGCYADFYDLDEDLVDCNFFIDECYDVGDLFFGMCDMYMGVAVVNGVCEGVSGCGWTLDGFDYSDAFYNSFDDCEQNCLENLYTCEDIEDNYGELHTGIYSACELDNDCMSVWGHCDVGLGGCHYAVNTEEYPSYQINALVNDWDTYECGGGVCDCMGLPNAVCNDGNCDLAYCYDENPAGCFSAGCPEGYECIDTLDNCTPSSCFCDESSWYGDWYCTEDCGGGVCIPILYGDINSDSFINVSDVVLLINIILNPDINEYYEIADIDLNLEINILDVVLLVNMILSNY